MKPRQVLASYFDLFRHSFGPMVAIYASLSDQPALMTELDAAFFEFVARWNRSTDGRVAIPYEYSAGRRPQKIDRKPEG